MTEIYDNRITGLNEYRGGIYQQAISSVTNLNNDWYDGKAYQVYGFEYEPGADGKIKWFIGKDATWMIDGRAVGPNGNIGQRVIPVEPMTIIFNLGISNSFAGIDEQALEPLFPAKMRVNWIRVYQDENSKSLTCDPEGRETSRYIEEHKQAYTDRNLTKW